MNGMPQQQSPWLGMQTQPSPEEMQQALMQQQMMQQAGMQQPQGMMVAQNQLPPYSAASDQSMKNAFGWKPPVQKTQVMPQAPVPDSTGANLPPYSESEDRGFKNAFGTPKRRR